MRRSKGTANSLESPGKMSKKAENSWLMLVKDKLFNENSFNIITLPHPASGKSSKYCLDHSGGIYEVVTYDEPYRSWFIGEMVKSDGSIYILTPINPLFLILPKLKKQCSERAMPLEDLLSEKGFNKIIDTIRNMDSVADLKGPLDVKAYRYNETKTLDWLESRVRKLSMVLRGKNIHVTPGAASATYVASNVSNKEVDEEFYLKYAHGIIAEYLEDDLMESLEKRFNFKPELIETLGKKRKSEVEENVAGNKKVKSENLDDKEYKENVVLNVDKNNGVKKTTPLTAKEKARQKAASGTKTISSFFKKS